MDKNSIAPVVAALVEKAKLVEYHDAENRFILHFKSFAEGQPDRLVPLRDAIEAVGLAFGERD